MDEKTISIHALGSGAIGILEQEIARLRAIISVLVDDLGGDAVIPVGRIVTASAIALEQDGEGRDDELMITVLYPA